MIMDLVCEKSRLMECVTASAPPGFLPAAFPEAEESTHDSVEILRR